MGRKNSLWITLLGFIVREFGMCYNQVNLSCYV